MDTFTYDGLSVVVTGAGRGIGREYALLLAARGAQVAVVDLGANVDGSGVDGDDPAATVVAEITAAGGRAVAIRDDVSTEEGAARIIAATVEAFGRVEAVINNAGILNVAAFDQVTPAEYQRHIDVHYLGSLWMARAAWPHLKESGRGRIVNSISAAMLGQPGMAHYGASKGAVLGLTRCLAVEGAADGIKVNAVAPGAGGTRLAEASVSTLPPEIVDFMRTSLLPAQVAPVAAYLVHPECAVTGEVFNVAGGFVNRMAIVNSDGFHDPELSIESVAAHLDQVMTMPEGSQVQVVPVPETV